MSDPIDALCGTNGACKITLLHVVPSLGVLTCFGMYVAPWMEIENIVKSKSIGNFNPLPNIMLCVNCLAWVMYSFIIDNYYVFAPNFFGILFTLFYTLSIFHLANENQRVTLKYFLLIGLAVIFLGSVVCFVSLPNLNPLDKGKPKLVMGYISVAVLIAFYSSPLSTMFNVIKNKDASSISFGLALANGFNGLLWTCYGFALNDPFIYAPNLLGVFTVIIQVALIFIYGLKSTPFEFDEQIQFMETSTLGKRQSLL